MAAAAGDLKRSLGMRLALPGLFSAVDYPTRIETK
jgi:hypothetical protein